MCPHEEPKSNIFPSKGQDYFIPGPQFQITQSMPLNTRGDCLRKSFRNLNQSFLSAVKFFCNFLLELHGFIHNVDKQWIIRWLRQSKRVFGRIRWKGLF